MPGSPTPIRRLRVAGFKSIKQLDLSLRPINVLVGANGSGKSNFLSLFTFLRRLAEGRLRSYVEQNGFADAFLHCGADRTEKITLRLDMADGGRYDAEFVHDEADDTLAFAGEDRPWGAKEPNPAGRAAAGRLQPAGVMDQPDETPAMTLPACLATYRVYHFHDVGDGAPFKRACKRHDDAPLRPDAANLAAFLYRLREEYPRDYREIVSTIRCIAPFFRDFHLVPEGRKGDESILLQWRHRDYGGALSANQLPNGAARFICLAALLLQPRALMPPTIILDEPELGLHPFAIEVTAGMFKTLPRGIQIICATQSVQFINHFNPEDLIVVDSDKGASIFSRPNVAALEMSLEYEHLGDLWDSNMFKGQKE